MLRAGSRVGTIPIRLPALAGLLSGLIPNAIQPEGFTLCFYVLLSVYLVSIGVRDSGMSPLQAHSSA